MKVVDVSQIIRENWKILENFYGQIPEFLNPPLFSYKRSGNFSFTVSTVRTESKMGRRGSSYPGMASSNYGHIVKWRTFKHPITGTEYQIRHTLTCRYDFVIYVLQCPCPLLYVSEATTECSIRLNNHKSTILTRKVDLPVPRNFAEYWITFPPWKGEVIEKNCSSKGKSCGLRNWIPDIQRVLI